MPLSSTELVAVAEITLELYSVVEERADLLNDDQIVSIQNDLDTWEGIRDSHVRFSGDGVDFDEDRDREAIRYRIRKMLGLPLYSTESSGGNGCGSFAVANVPVF